MPGECKGFKEDGRRSRSNSKFDLIAHDDEEEDVNEQELAERWVQGWRQMTIAGVGAVASLA